jgi:hypothetical protein
MTSCPAGARWLRFAGALVVALGLLVVTRSEARAQRSGPYEFNFKIGPAIGVSDAPTQFALQLEFGLAVTGDRNGYLIFPLQLQFSAPVFVAHFPIGFQYEFPIRSVRGLYLYPRGWVGFSVDHESGVCIQFDRFGRCIGGNFGSSSAPGIAFGLGFGIKYILKGRWNFFFEPFNLPIGVYFFGDPVGTIVSVWYGINFGVGINF